MAGLLGRVFGTVVGALLVWAGLSMADGPYQERVHYPRAPWCEELDGQRSPHGCLRRTQGRVVAKAQLETGPTLRLRWASGAEQTYHLEGSFPPCHDDARRGSRADMVIWHGKLMRVTVRGRTCEVGPNGGSALVLSLLLAWTGLGLALACLLWHEGPWEGRALTVRSAAWAGLGLCAYFPGIRVLAEEGSWWVWALCLPPGLLCLALLLAPLHASKSAY
ncbi:hypothetical protein ITI46_11530 [Streptomyces oryzae]|uniref:Uncharacterized protein n=1 Tax=Streptomyces oryzae TaxID=1434886 RepID=A0ABS3XB46_9ACTN|nr:hypothetical protein [Streptomyces oryzae]MBO8192292.1 hypothetical protein [Streptomyces oryzae]